MLFSLLLEPGHQLGLRWRTAGQPRGAGMESVRQLLLAAERGSQDDLQLLLNYPNDISPDACTANGRTALMAAASHNHCRCAEVLMNKGASIDFADENCNTALHVAALNGNCAMINLLVRRGANINAVTRKAKTPFALACQGGAAEAARILACTGCSIPIGSSATERSETRSSNEAQRRTSWITIAASATLKTPETYRLRSTLM